MYRLALVENDKDFLSVLQDYCEQYKAQSNFDIDVVAFHDGDELASDYKPLYDIIVLNTVLNRLNGIETASYVRTLDSEVMIILTADTEKYAVKGYTVGAFRYLLKPLSYADFKEALTSAFSILDDRKRDFILVPAENGVKRLDICEILFVESMNHRLIFHTKDKEYSMGCTMREIQKRFEKHHFFRCHNCYLVNFAYIKEVSDNCAVIGDSRLMISRSRRKAFRKDLENYLNTFN